MINKPESIKGLKEELRQRSAGELVELCLRLSRFKKENKELLTYLLFDSTDEPGYIKSVKSDMDEQFEQINTTSSYFIKKSIRKILKNTRKHIRYSGKKETEVELLIYFCFKMKNFRPPLQNNTSMNNLHSRLMESVKKSILTLHEDLQYDYGKAIEGLL
ncbi:MAG: hypothetical protein K0B08_04610 [Bacteroidales bacterium]|nr:hypothetical protein [Bacteroidales bacterium]